jgi:predicted membrane protein
LGWLYGRVLLGLPVALAYYSFHRTKIQPINLPVSFEINIVAGIMILAALCDPDLKRAFGRRE